MLEFDPTAFLLIIGTLNLALSAFVFVKNRNETGSLSFGLMAFMVALWSFASFAFLVSGLATVLFFGYVLYIVAAFLPTSFLLMALAFPPYSLLKKGILAAISLELLTIIYLTGKQGLVISDLNIAGGERILIWGKYYVIYVLHHTLIFFSGYVVLAWKYFQAQGIQRKQVQYVILGTIIPANLAMATNLLMPWFGNYSVYTWMGQMFMIFLVSFSGYAIYKHRLFDIKTIATETFVLASSLTLLVRFFTASSQSDRLIAGAVLLAVSIFGYLLIKSVWKEVEHREKVESLASQLKSANDQLKALDRARAEFISIASHQLRTPPATIKWYLAAVLDGDYGKLAPKVKQALLKAQITNNALISLIDDMLNVSRIERGKMEFLYEKADIGKLVEETVLELTPQASVKKLKLRYVRPKAKLPMILADKEKLQQVVNNLVDNALKYTKTGVVTVTLGRSGGNIVIKVSDTGKGLDPGQTQAIFEKFGRGKDANKQASGLGLGLYVAKVIAEHHRGSITAESKGLGRGSTFTVTLPIETDLKAEVFDLTKA